MFFKMRFTKIHILSKISLIYTFFNLHKHHDNLKSCKKRCPEICLWKKFRNFVLIYKNKEDMGKDNNERQLTEYEKYCQMMAQQQEEEIDEIISGDMNEEAPEGVFVRGH